MICYLSKNQIFSFCGDVVCLKLKSDEDIERANIVWETDSDVVEIKEFQGDFSFNDGVLLVLRKEGEATVSAKLDGVEYSCRVTVSERQKAAEGEAMNYYIGDLHVHTTMEHGDQAFYYRTAGFPRDSIKMTQEDGRLDFTVVSDHGSITYDKNFFEAFTDAEENDDGKLIVFPGSESEISYVTKNIHGLPEVPCGEFVLLNSSSYCFVDSFEKAEKIISKDPLPIVSIAHPQEISSMKGFCLSGLDLTDERTDGWKRLIKLIELGNGTDRGNTMLFEYSYSLALDNGYKLAPVSTSDSHGPVWGYEACPGKTVVLAPKKTKELLIDAIYNRRVYATENGATRLSYTVNGHMMGSDIPLTDRYDFHVEIGSLREDYKVETIRCEVISDYGEKVKIIEDVDFSSFDFTVESRTARYFYLRIVHGDETKTFSPPVFLGREIDKNSDGRDLARLDKSRVRVIEASTEGAEALLCGDPSVAWYTDRECAEVVFDMGEDTELSALRIWDHYLSKPEFKEIRAGRLSGSQFVSAFLARFRISLSLDGTNYKAVTERYLQKVYNGFYARFPKQRAKYVKLELLSSVGKEYGRTPYKNAKIKLGEIDFYK